MTDSEQLRGKLDEYLTVGTTFTLSADTQVVGAGSQLKRGTVREVSQRGAEVLSGDGGSAYTIVSDEPRAIGGEDTAPYPLQYFLAGTAF